MQLINVRELRSAVPKLQSLLAREQELVLTSNGEPVARILPLGTPPQLQSTAWIRAMSPPQKTDSTVLIREDRDRRGS